MFQFELDTRKVLGNPYISKGVQKIASENKGGVIPEEYLVGISARVTDARPLSQKLCLRVENGRIEDVPLSALKNTPPKKSLIQFFEEKKQMLTGGVIMLAKFN